MMPNMIIVLKIELPPWLTRGRVTPVEGINLSLRRYLKIPENITGSKSQRYQFIELIMECQRNV